MAERKKIVDFVNKYLSSETVKDIAHNGLQIEGSEQVNKIAFGVSASLACMRQAKEYGAQMLITHHGLLWGYEQAFTGTLKQKLQFMFANDISLCSWHLPLDKHPVVGNNAQLLKLLNGAGQKPFGNYHGEYIGVSGYFKKTVTINDVAEMLALRLDSEPLCFRFGKEQIKTVAIVSGGAANMFEQAVAQGIDLYITGEASEQTQEFARETRSNFICAGHYNTEKTGVKALSEIIEKRFKVKTEFIDIPNPL